MEKFVHVYDTVPSILFDTPKELINKNRIIELIKQYCMKHKFEYTQQESENSFSFVFKYHENRDVVAEYMRTNATLIG